MICSIIYVFIVWHHHSVTEYGVLIRQNLLVELSQFHDLILRNKTIENIYVKTLKIPNKVL